MAKTVIGVVGQIGSGKDTAIGFLKKQGFSDFSLSDQIRVELKKQGRLDFTRKEIQDLGDQMRAKHGDDYWARQAWEQAMASGQDKLVISGIRHPAEVEFVKTQPNASLLAVIADQRLRFERKLAAAKKDPTSVRSDDKDLLTWEGFKKADERETKEQKEHSQQVSKVVAMADFTVENNGTVEELGKKMDEVLAQNEGTKKQ